VKAEGRKMMRDKTTWRLISIALTCIGLFAALLKSGVPELSATYADFNPFFIKQNEIELVMKWFFTGIAFIGIFIQVILIIGENTFGGRKYSTRTYIFISVLLIAAAFPITKTVNIIGNELARSRWLPKIVENQRDLYLDIEFLIENDYLRQNQLALKDSDREMYRKENLKDLYPHIEQLEKLLDISQSNSELKTRLVKIKPFFKTN
jgi:hypothetical protein